MLIEIRVELHKQAIGHVPRQGNLVDANSISCSCYILYCEFNPPMMMGGVMGRLGVVCGVAVALGMWGRIQNTSAPSVSRDAQIVSNNRMFIIM
jgi:hypothetical protein